MTDNPYRPIKAKLEKVITETGNIKTFVLKPEEDIGFLAGQFMMVTVPGKGEAPFTPSSDPHVKDTIEFTIMKAGATTSILHSMKEGEVIGLRGPFGKPYPIQSFHGKDIYVIGGGVGLAPLRALLLSLSHELEHLNKIEVRFGARTPNDFSYKTQIEQWRKWKKTNFVMTVDAGDPSWKGNVGLVTTILKEGDVDIKNAVAILCGPPIMMKFANARLLDMGFAHNSIFLSMEKNMSCGVGKCFKCNLGKHLCCKDGPVFTWDQIKDIPEPW
jgi:NAD(P)H-flavin reductase